MHFLSILLTITQMKEMVRSLKIPIAQFALVDLEEAKLTSVKTIMNILNSDMGFRNQEKWTTIGGGIVPMKLEGRKQEKLQRK